MSRTGCKMLDTGDAFPRLSIDTVDGRRIELPDYFDSRWNILLFYRGHW